MKNEKLPLGGMLLMALVMFAMTTTDLSARFIPRAPLTSVLPSSPVPVKPQVISVSLEQQAVIAHLAAKYNKSSQFVGRIVRVAYQEAYRVGMSPLLVLAVMEKESGLDPHAVSGYGAVGLMQVVPRFHYDKFGPMRTADGFYNPEANIRAGAAILAEYSRANNGNIMTALTKYSGQAHGYAQRVVSYKQELEAVKAKAAHRQA